MTLEAPGPRVSRDSRERRHFDVPLSKAYLIVGRAATIRYAECIRLLRNETAEGSKWTYGGVSDLAILHGNIEVDADEDALALEVEVCDREFV